MIGLRRRDFLKLLPGALAFAAGFFSLRLGSSSAVRRVSGSRYLGPAPDGAELRYVEGLARAIRIGDPHAPVSVLVNDPRCPGVQPVSVTAQRMLRVAAEERLMMAGNRCGKTESVAIDADAWLRGVETTFKQLQYGRWDFEREWRAIARRQVSDGEFGA